MISRLSSLIGLGKPAAPNSGSYSLLRRLTAATVGAGMIAGLVSTAIVLVIARSEINEAYDETLEEGARLVLALGEGALSRDAGNQIPRMRNMQRLDYQIISRSGIVLSRGKGAPKQPFIDPRRRDDRFYDTTANGKRWRVYVRRDKSLGFSVQIGQEWKDRNELVFEVLESLIWPLAGLWMLLGLANWWLVRRLSAPLAQVARRIGEKSHADLSPVPDDSRAQEIRAMVNALNRLLDRLSRALEGERRFTADAAHELRTPLAALASRIQVMQRSYADQSTPALMSDLQRLRDDVGRSTALVEKLLQLARLDPQSGDTLIRENVDLQVLLDDVVQTCATLARERQVSLDIDCTVSSLCAHREALFSALRNLLDNAVRYGREGGQVQVSIRYTDDHAVIICVQDDGEGVSDDDLRQLTHRFYRVLGSGAPGSGLGLSIVARVAELHGGTLTFGPGLNGRGLSATMTLPR